MLLWMRMPFSGMIARVGGAHQIIGSPGSYHGKVPCSYAAIRRDALRSPPTARMPSGEASLTGGNSMSESKSRIFIVTKVETTDLAIVKTAKEIIERIKLGDELPGLKAQLKAAPPYRPMDITEIELRSARKAAVLLLLVPSETEGWELVFILRAQYDGVHSNQIGLPGGEVDEIDNGLLDTALRECVEEIGVEVAKENVLGALTELYIPPSKFLVQPFVALLDYRPRFIPEVTEVADVLTIGLGELIDGGVWSRYEIKGIQVPGFELKGNVVWGATAMMIAEFIECCGGMMPEIPLHHERS